MNAFLRPMRVLVFGVALGSLFVPRPAAGQDAEPVPPDLDELMDYYDDLYRSESSTATMVLTVTKPRGTRTLKMRVWTRGQDKALIVIDSPAREAGTATLKVGDKLWFYFPKISRTIRLPPSMRRGSWMGSDITNDDLVKDSSYRQDYTYEITGRSDKPRGWIVMLSAKPETAGLWKRIEMIVTDDGKVPLEHRFYDRKGRHARTMTFGEVREIEGRLIPTRLVFRPEDKEGRSTEVRYLDLKFNVKVPDRTFNLQQLERKR